MIYTFVSISLEFITFIPKIASYCHEFISDRVSYTCDNIISGSVRYLEIIINDFAGFVRRFFTYHEERK